jgi:NH3-dependent NAD+ synthetase
MATTIKLGKNTTVAGVTGVNDSSITLEVEKIEAMTRGATGVAKRSVPGMTTRSLEVTAIGDYSRLYGAQTYVVVAVSGVTELAMTGVITNIKRAEPIGEKISQTLTIKPGYALDAGDQITV